MNRRMAKARDARKRHAARARWRARNPVVITLRIDGYTAASLALALHGCALGMLAVASSAAAAREASDRLAAQLDQEERAAGEGFGLVVPELCGTCGEFIDDDELAGTTCACAPRLQAFLAAVPGEAPRPRTWSPLLCECTGTGPTCGYCRGHGVP